MAVVWKHLKHQNIVPLISITSTPLQLISEWLPGGNLAEYIAKCPDIDRLDLVGVSSVALNNVFTPITSYLMSLKASATFTPVT